MQDESPYLIERRARMMGIARPKEEKKQKPIAHFSKKREKKQREYRKIVKKFLSKNIRCQVKGCNKISEDVHHTRGRVGDLLTDERYFLAVCRDHHTLIECSPEWAKQKGYSQSRLK